MTKLNVKFIITVVAIVFASVVIGLGALAINKINQLNAEIENINSRITQIDFNNSVTQNKIDNLKNEIQRQLAEQSRNFSDVSYKITDINTQNNTAVVEVYFSLKESPLSGDIEINFGKGDQFSQIAAMKLVSGKYMAEIELQMNKDYEVSYSVTLSSIKTEKLFEINVLKQLRNRLSIQSGYYSESRERWYIDFYLSNGYFDNNNLKISTAVLEVYKNNTLIKTIDIKDYAVQAGSGYEQFSSKDIVISELTHNDFADNKVSTRITVVDNYGLEYTF